MVARAPLLGIRGIFHNSNPEQEGGPRVEFITLDAILDARKLVGERETLGLLVTY